MILFHQTNQTAKIKRLFRLRQFILPAFQIQPVDVGQQRSGVRHAADTQIDMFVLQPALLTLHLLQQCAAHTADANDEHFDHLIGVEQHLVRDTDTGGRVIIAHHNRNRALGRALGNGHDVDVGACQRGKEFCGDPAQGAHSVADDRDNRQAFLDRQRFQQLFFQLQIKLIFQRATRTATIRLRHAEADAVFRGGLRDEHNGDTVARHRGKHTCGHADHAFHPRTGDAEHRHVIEVRDAFDRQIVFIMARANQRSWRLRVTGIFDEARDLELGNRGDGAWMEDFCAEIRQLHRFLIRHRFQQPCVRHLARIAGIDAVNVRPDFAAIGAQTSSQHGGRVVGTVTAQHHEFALLVTGSEARHQNHMVSRDFTGGDATGRFGDIDGGFEVMAHRQQFFDRVDHRDMVTTRFQQARHDGD
ncbi:hypothetical protein D3C72_1045590 [compost metagenome]